MTQRAYNAEADNLVRTLGVANLPELGEHCESTEYFQSVHYWTEECRQSGPAFWKRPERDPK